MIVVVADASGLVAALDATHPAGDGARQVLRDSGALVISPVILSELDHVARRVLGDAAALQALEDVERWVALGRAVLPTVTADTLSAARSVRERHADLRLDLADAMTVAVAADVDTDAILTLDERDFRAVRPLTGHVAFRLLPADS